MAVDVFRSRREFLYASLVADIEFEGGGAAAEGADFFFKDSEVVVLIGALAAGEHKVGSGPGECAREILAKTAARAGDNGDAAGQVEEIVRHMRPGRLSWRLSNLIRSGGARNSGLLAGSVWGDSAHDAFGVRT